MLECGVVITAEAFPKCEKSTRTRCLRLKLSEPIHNSLLAPLQEHPELLGNVLEHFIVHIAGHFDEIVHQIEEDFRTYRESRANPDAHPVSSERLYVIGFVLYTALKIFLENCELDSSQVSETLANFNKRLGRCIDWQLSPKPPLGKVG